MDPVKLNQLKQFIQQCKSNPSILSDPSLSFFRDYIESLGGVSSVQLMAPEITAKSHVVDESDDEIDDVENDATT
ncbi:hypothetical protein HAX54_041586 [Datura stramonium]|uniref:Hsp70-interacting protein N-terminal domain-containing protein n=1 Tax=Datura stramonium TaxID=4076 RepID=A0ABS8SMH7_DATST|nr:hypothetical protein [Datura stramonium]